MAAPTRFGEAKPPPAAMARPPRNAPVALPRLKAATAAEEARTFEVLPPAVVSTRLVNAGTVAKPTVPSANSVRTAGILAWAVWSKQQQHADKHGQQCRDRGHEVPVSGPGTERVADDEPETEHDQQQGDGGRSEVRDRGHHRGDIGKGMETLPPRKITYRIIPYSR